VVLNVPEIFVDRGTLLELNRMDLQASDSEDLDGPKRFYGSRLIIHPRFSCTQNTVANFTLADEDFPLLVFSSDALVGALSTHTEMLNLA
jgi:hypothetical protein